ncbi:predicted protein [Nematostella vectensis]|uniref:G-protein coupled receptors family 1 profile domain-containing protein n=1 Tax=Nematostella vectensis TaxID=45351 RepID=A7RU74_NEMVE|nr:predicted protein [Nematostella vectensis]|eukprot:XP_001637095.1 predicted protein [Nematostella vectensis]
MPASLFGGGPLMSRQEMLVWCVVFAVEALITVFGNSFTIAIFTSSYLRQNRAFYFLVNLAIADLLVGLSSMPLFIMLFTKFFSGEYISELLFVSHRFVDSFTSFVALFSLVLVAVERMYAVVYPLRHRTTRVGSYIACALAMWVFSLAVSVLGTLPSHIDQTISFYLFFILHSSALIVVSISYVIVWKWVVCRVNNTAARQRDPRDRRLARTLALVTVMSIVAWVPFQVIHYVETLCLTCAMVPNTPLYFSKLLHYGNSLINPVLYCFRIPEFNKTASKFFVKMHLREASQQSVPVELDELKGGGVKFDAQDTRVFKPGGREVVSYAASTPPTPKGGTVTVITDMSNESPARSRSASH